MQTYIFLVAHISVFCWLAVVLSYGRMTVRSL